MPQGHRLTLLLATIYISLVSFTHYMSVFLT